MFSECDLGGLRSGCGMLSSECLTVSLVLLFACARVSLTSNVHRPVRANGGRVRTGCAANWAASTDCSPFTLRCPGSCCCSFH